MPDYLVVFFALAITGTLILLLATLPPRKKVTPNTLAWITHQDPTIWPEESMTADERKALRNND